jgi:hypothetical protein
MSTPRSPEHEPEPTAQLPDYSDDGVDLSLIRWMLSLTPAEPLEFLQRHVNRILAIRAYANDAEGA